MIAEARKLGYSEATIWRNIIPKLQTIAVYYEKRGVCFYDPAITRDDVVWVVRRYLHHFESLGYASLENGIPAPDCIGLFSYRVIGTCQYKAM